MSRLEVASSFKCTSIAWSFCCGIRDIPILAFSHAKRRPSSYSQHFAQIIGVSLLTLNPKPYTLNPKGRIKEGGPRPAPILAVLGRGAAGQIFQPSHNLGFWGLGCSDNYKQEKVIQFRTYRSVYDGITIGLT